VEMKGAVGALLPEGCAGCSGASLLLYFPWGGSQT
jgi:hypothetical protein